MAKLYESNLQKCFDLGISKAEIPSYIAKNLKHTLFAWQEKALSNFLANEAIREEEAKQDSPNHLMFNMATGAGKTLIMATLILYYYKQGYRHFLFFVNRNNIVDKTENNFVNSQHSKYLFKDKIIIDDETIAIKKVNNFSESPQGIEIKFTSIQKLYNDIHIQRENQTTLEDLRTKDIVMLADEAHHLNTSTKRDLLQNGELNEKSSKEKIERLGWEHTVIDLILNKNGNLKNNRNVLLEFTATIPENASVVEKYEDKLISEFSLKEFLSAGYTKEISLLSSTLGKKERMLQALLFHWYRHVVAVDNNIPNFKPVMLFRSKTIEESKADYEFFLSMVDNLQTKDFNFMKTIMDKLPSKTNDIYENSESNIKRLMQYIKDKKIKYSEIVNFLKRNFQEVNVIITNSKDGTKTMEKTTFEQEALLNNLEDKNNHIRAIFTVERLTEGWDVLNLYDIVRLYEGQNTGGSTRKTPETTTKEKQLIGRGVRYCPFPYEDKLKNKRKFDGNTNHDLRILEELFYYTYDEKSRYISDLKRELKKDGYLHSDKELLTFAVKPDFEKNPFYKESVLWKNVTEDDPNYRKKTLKEIKDNFAFKEEVTSFEITEEYIVIDKKTDIERAKISERKKRTLKVRFSEFENHIFRKAVNMLAKQNRSVFRFDKLSNLLEVTSIDDLQKDKFIGDVNLHIVVPNAMHHFSDLENQEKCRIVMRFLEKIFSEIENMSHPKIGSKKFIPTTFEKEFGTPKEKIVNSNDINKGIADESWYVLNNFAGTGEEVSFISFFQEHLGKLDDKYNEIYLLRNEEVYKIYDFEGGRGFQPDFLLFLVTNGKKPLSYQIFIEPKGNQFMDSERNFTHGKEGWKEKFLLQLTELYGFDNKIEKEFPKYRLIGFPFYNAYNINKNGEEDPFFQQFNKLLL